MLKVNKKIEYALMALKFMAAREDGALTSAREICDKFNTPFDTTAKVMQTMNSNDILKSVKGIKGGYSLNKKLSEITYMDLVRMIEGVDGGSICQGHKGTCELFGTCNISTPMKKLYEKINEYLEGLSLEELLLENDFPTPAVSFEKSTDVGQQ